MASGDGLLPFQQQGGLGDLRGLGPRSETDNEKVGMGQGALRRRSRMAGKRAGRWVGRAGRGFQRLWPLRWTRHSCSTWGVVLPSRYRDTGSVAQYICPATAVCCIYCFLTSPLTTDTAHFSPYLTYQRRLRLMIGGTPSPSLPRSRSPVLSSPRLRCCPGHSRAGSSRSCCTSGLLGRVVSRPR